MIRDRLRYHAPPDVDIACRILADSSSATVIGGGTIAVPRLGRGEVRADDVVHLHRAGLTGVRLTGDELSIGSMVTYTELLATPGIDQLIPLLCTVARGITGGDQIRNQGTLGGSLCHANPASDVPTALAALQARLILRSVHGEREVRAEEFLRGGFQTTIRPGEILTHILVRPVEKSGYCKFKLSESSWPIVTAAATVSGGRCHVVLGGVEPAPVRIDLSSVVTTESAIRELVAATVRPLWSDALAPAEYRHLISGEIAARAVAQLGGM
ncbi:FAD binding domain-containing protein [Amycolatopsis thermalba]|uniref:FAD binding domain-containing protein n=1 Tax=Amycolatopsis thermalba TaxID=944492 RepID=A0ABY4P182_9PSEU|nr:MULTISPECIES: FAD binding domain-containing protein [Amycolatopsis]UQS25978.1 FAD binding domain-containing protein [Amycolatopsis thermalba]